VGYASIYLIIFNNSLKPAFSFEINDQRATCKNNKPPKEGIAIGPLCFREVGEVSAVNPS